MGAWWGGGGEGAWCASRREGARKPAAHLELARCSLAIVELEVVAGLEVDRVGGGGAGLQVHAQALQAEVIKVHLKAAQGNGHIERRVVLVHRQHALEVVAGVLVAPRGKAQRGQGQRVLLAVAAQPALQRCHLRVIAQARVRVQQHARAQGTVRRAARLAHRRGIVPQVVQARRRQRAHRAGGGQARHALAVRGLQALQRPVRLQRLAVVPQVEVHPRQPRQRARLRARRAALRGPQLEEQQRARAQKVAAAHKVIQGGQLLGARGRAGHAWLVGLQLCQALLPVALPLAVWQFKVGALEPAKALLRREARSPPIPDPLSESTATPKAAA